MTRSFAHSLYFRVLVGILLGVVVGVLAPEQGAKLKPLADVFIRLVTMTIAPLIFCTLVPGVASHASIGGVGKAGGLAILYFEVVSTIALAIGLVIVNVVSPGSTLHHVVGGGDADKLATLGKPKSSFILDVIPELGGHSLLSVLLVALLFAFALRTIGERGAPVLDLVERIGAVVFAVVAMIMQLAPLGAFGAMAFTVSTFGSESLESLGTLMLCFYATCLVFLFGVLALVARAHGFSVFRFVRYIRQELLIVLGTSSSESVLPRMMEKLERLGAGKPTVGLVIPAGYSFNLDGTAIYVTMGALFVAQATHTDLSLGDQIALLGIAMLTSKGAAGVTGAGFVTLVATLQAFTHDGVPVIPVGALLLIFGIDRFMSEARALTNVIGNGVATLVVARWCGDLDRAQLKTELLQKQQESR
ncbi:MAG: C4-dicarboxylate transporter DctA [Acidobacteriota bacterium]